VAAVACGAASASAGWAWAALLVTYFVASSVVSAVGRGRKEARTAPIVAKTGERDAAQVLANGGVFALAAIASTAGMPEMWRSIITCGAAGALAASAADTWATEVGVLSGGVARSVVTRTVVPAGESGGVSWTGTLGGAAGAAFVAGVAALLGLARGAPLAPLLAGMVGSLVDSVLGATLQARRRCDVCGALTERQVHDCGGATRHAQGVRWIDNDVVNVTTTVAGFVIAGALGAWWLRD
jgi:uncharacterized protein (TIGR00297 family)